MEEWRKLERELDEEELGDAAWILDDEIAYQNVFDIWRQTATDEEIENGGPTNAELKALVEFYLMGRPLE
jgi:hypothetical protein